MHGKNKLKGIALLSAISVIALPMFSKIQMVLGTDINVSQTTRAKLKEKSEKLEQELKQAKSEIASEISKKDALDKQIAIVKEQIDISNKSIENLNNEIEQSEKNIEILEAEKVKKMDSLKVSLRSIYIAGDASTIDIILGAKTFEEFLDKAQMVKTVSTTISNLIDDLNKCIENIVEEKNAIEQNRIEAEEENTVLGGKQEELQVLIDENEAILAELHEQESSVKDELDANDAELQKIEAEIQAYYEEQKRKAEQEARRKAAEEEQRKKQQEQQKNQSSQSSSSNKDTESDATPVSTGAYAWPVPGFTKLTTNFNDPDTRGIPHGGIDIAGAKIYGAKVVAAADGKVIQANGSGWGGGYGIYLTIDHGNGRSTLYAHLSGLSVKLGDTVKKGQVIGYVGSTGRSTGPHLHFETRLYGVKYNPMMEY